jgi:hypothetical protein
MGDILLRYPLNGGNLPGQKGRADTLETLVLTARLQQCEKLVKHVIGGYKRLYVFV